ncbi:MAG: hypothetical protein PHU47_01260 [Candidatus ainarchaeum sp.]|nr:hypothetical protein [Candidatus ainarchaeum sp.]
MKKIILLTFALFLISCVSKREFTELNSKYSNSESEKVKLLQEIEELKTQHNDLSSKIENCTKEKNELQVRYNEATQTPEYYYKKGIEFLKLNQLKKAFLLFNMITTFYPNSDLVKNSNNKISELDKISNSNLKSTLNKTKSLSLGKKISSIQDDFDNLFLNKNDSIKLRNIYNKYLYEYESEEFISETEDKMQSCIFYETKRLTCQHSGRALLTFEFYIVKNKSGSKFLRLRTQYSNDNWMFYDKVIVHADNIQIEINCDYPEKQTDTSGNGVKEWSDNSIDNLDKSIFKIAESDKIDVRFVGKYAYEMTLNDAQTKALKEIIAKYKKL